MKYNCKLGSDIMKKYLGTDDLQKRLEHSEGVAEFAFKVAQQIKGNNPELTSFEPEFVGFLGYVHDIGYSVEAEKHETHTVDLLNEREGIYAKRARMAMHGQLVEQFGEIEGNVEQYMPHGIEGMILTYADMSVRTGGPIALKDRAEEIVERVKGIPGMPDQLKLDIETNLYKALPRFEKYERIVLALAGVESVKDF